MRRNYTMTRSYLMQPEDISKSLGLIDNAISETWRNGKETDILKDKSRKMREKGHKTVKEIREKISRIEDENCRFILTKRYLEFKSDGIILQMTGWSEKYLRNLYDRALMNLEIILLEDGVFTLINPKADMMEEYEDGFRAGKREGRKIGYKAGFCDGYNEGYVRGEQCLPYGDNEDDEFRRM